MSDDKTIGEELSQEEYLARVRTARLSDDELARRYGRDGRPAPDALPPDAIAERLEALVYPVLSMRRSVRPAAEALAWLPAARVEGLLGQLGRVCLTSLELGYQLCVQAAEVLRFLPDEAIAPWLVEVLEVYDRQGTQGCIRKLGRLEQDAARLCESAGRTTLAERLPVLEAFLAGLAGRALRIVPGDSAYTDTETIRLPESLARFERPEDNFRLYTCLVAHLWSQTWYGTWREPWGQRLARFADPRLGLRLFQSAETLRLESRLALDLPGLARQMGRLAGRGPLPPGWQAAALRLAAPGAAAGDAWDLALGLEGAGEAPLPPPCWQGTIEPERVAEAMAARLVRERDRLALDLAALVEAQGLDQAAGAGPRAALRLESARDPDWPEGVAFRPILGERPLIPAPETVQLMQSICQDFGQIPPEYLEAAGQGIYARRQGTAREDAAPPAGPEPDAFVYDEWDYGRQGYRKGWCRLRERPVHPEPGDFVAETRHKYRGLLKHLYRTFEALRGEDRLLRREPQGEDPDIDAIVDAFADAAQGLEPSDRLFQRRRKVERDVAVLFMVDMSGSTKGWINEVERESLVLLCESLERLRDRYAIYGFSGYTHMRCDAFRVKGFDEPYDCAVHARIAGIRPQDYTRLGVAIRHLAGRLAEVEARTRVLLLLSDGRPDDEDGYRGDYGIEDTRQAVLEARARGIHPFCITVDDAAQAYLPHLFGPAGWTLVDKVGRLPYRVSDIYRRLTA
jgi:nitric oxide reductase NorD protein